MKAPSFFAKGARQGERSLTDVLHLAELLQEASLKLDGEQALIRFLQDQRTSIDRAGIRREAQQVRLESDENLVQVVTIHKSKGLEYDLVFIPFIALIHKPKSTVGSLYRWHNDQGDLCVTLTPDKTTKLRVQQEQLAEDLRKLYVAMTRARYATWLGFGPVENVEQSALGYLLTGGEAIPKGTFNEWLNALQLGAPDHIALIPSQGLHDQRWSEHEAHQSPLRARTSTRCFRENWWIASYSSLKKRSSAEGESPLWTPAPETPDADHYGSALLEEPPEATPDQIIPWPSILDTGSVHTFPTGAQAGTFLHDLLEWIAKKGFQTILQQPTLLREEIIRKSVIHGFGDAVDLLEDWLHHLLKMPLSAGILEHTIALQNLSIYQAEMEFWMTVRGAPILKIDDLICRATLQGLKRPALEDGTLNGMLKGFIDLVFLYEDRYYVLDYKSNRLGTDSLAYTPDKLQSVMLEARYDLQYVLYLLALHRHLKSRKSDYDYDRHMGGAIYLFLRGGDAESRGIYADRPPRLLIEHLDRLFDGPERGALS
jgi:exodeoxyribonuclease V beta subunit